MSCLQCGKKNEYSYSNKWIKFKNEWFRVFSTDRLTNRLAIIYDGKVSWIRPAQVQEVSDTEPENGN